MAGSSVSKSQGEDGEKPSAEDEAAISEGVFSWTAAWSMMFWVLGFICSMVMAVLAFQGSAFDVISEEVSFVRARNPPYGPEDQPRDALMRQIHLTFKYYLPQVALFYSQAAGSLGMFTVSYFTSFMLLEDQGTKKIVDIGGLISKGVIVYLERTIPVLLLFLFFGGWYVFANSGYKTLLCFSMGSVLNIISARVGVSMTVQGTTRLTHSMSAELFDSLAIGIRTGAVGGLLATSLALLGMSSMWLLIGDTISLSGFGSGASIVSFYLRVGGGIFSKGADIGGDLIGEMDEQKSQEEKRVFELQQRMMEMEEHRKERLKKGLAEEEEEMMDQLRMMEEEMQDIAAQLHPINYLDAIGENICDVSGTCADLFESMVLILSTSAIVGSKGSEVPKFFSGLPFWICASGNIGCSMVAYYCHVHERFTSRRIRWSLRLNLMMVVVFVQLVQIGVSFLERLRGSIGFDKFWHFVVISLVGQLAPEICVLSGEFFTSVDYAPVRNLAVNADLGVVQVVLQGLGQGFLSTGPPALIMIVSVIIAWRLESHYGLVLLSASSVSGTGFQGGIASYGAIATNAHKIVHLTTYHSMTRHRANICAALGDTTSHAGNTISAVNAFSSVFNVALTLLADSYTSMDMDYTAITGSVLSQWSQAGLVTGVVMTMMFSANTMLSCLETSQSFMRFCNESADVAKNEDAPFPYSHIKPLRILTSYGTVTSMRMVFSPIINTLVCPMVGGFFLGIKGLLFLISGSNVLILCLSIFLINSGQSWVAARKFILFGLLKDADGIVLGPDSRHYEHLGVGESIGGPFEDTTGPALNNFIKTAAVFAFVTSQGRIYKSYPGDTWALGIVALAGSLFLVYFSRTGLSLALKCWGSWLRQRREHQRQRDEEEGSESSSESDE